MIFNGQEITPLPEREIDTIRGWSLEGTPTSAPITLGLIETIYELQERIKNLEEEILWLRALSV